MELTTTYTSDSLIGNLCREAELIGCRSRQLTKLIRTCKDRPLLTRLREEFKSLQERKKELNLSTKHIIKNGKVDPISIAFLTEVLDRL